MIERSRRIEGLRRAIFDMGLLLAIANVRKGTSDQPVNLQTREIKSICINSTPIVGLSAPKKIPADDHKKSVLIKDLLSDILDEDGAYIWHPGLSMHEHAYIDSLAGQFGSHLTDELKKDKSRHKEKTLVKDIGLSKLDALLGSTDNTEHVHNVASEYTGCKITAWNPRLSKKPWIENDELHFKLASNQDVVSPSLFENLGWLIGCVEKNGRIPVILINDNGFIKKYSNRFNRQLCHIFSRFGNSVFPS